MRTDLLPHLEGITLSGRALRFPEDLPDHPLVLVVGFTHAARHDVGAWKVALAEQGLALLSLPTAAVDTPAEAMVSVAQAMRAHVPRPAWDQVVQVHRGGESLLRVFGWQADGFAKVLRVAVEGRITARHDAGAFSREALTAFLAGGTCTLE